MNRLQNHESTADIVLRATSDGQYVDFVVHVVMRVVEGVEENQMGIMVYPNPTKESVVLVVPQAQGFGYEVYDLSGRIVLSGNALGDEARLDMSGCPKGTYCVAIILNGNRLTKRIMVL